MIDSVEDIFKLESYILEEYDSVLRALHEYRVNEEDADEEIKNCRKTNCKHAPSEKLKRQANPQ